MENIITTEYDGIAIGYDEAENSWKFTLRGRDRTAPSLAKAKEFIDKPLPAEKAKPFEKFSAWFFRYSSKPEKIEVTGIAEQRYGQQEVWIKDSEGKRSKESVNYSIYPCSEENDAKVGEIIAKMNQQQKLRAEVDEIKGSMTHVEIKPEE